MSSFIFEKKEYDDEFYALDGKIEAYAKSLPGFIGMESYTDAASGRIINHYYWDNRADMQALMTNIEHAKAKELSDKWIQGFQVIIAKIEGAHNVNFPHPLASYPLPYQPV